MKTTEKAIYNVFGGKSLFNKLEILVLDKNDLESWTSNKNINV